MGGNQPMHAVNNHELAVLRGRTRHVSGHLPRNAQGVAVCGSAGGTATLEAAQHAVRIRAVQALAFMCQTLGSALIQITKARDTRAFLPSRPGQVTGQ